MENQQPNQDPISQTPLTPKTPVTTDTSTETILPPQPQLPPETPESPEMSSPAGQYQSFLNQYAATSSQSVPTDTTPPAPSYQNVPNHIDNYSGHESKLFKVIFSFSLVFFILVFVALGFVFYKNQTSSKNSLSEMEKDLPSPTPVDSCFLNEKTYLIGESFTATDGCNTCVCEAQDSISCTNNECLSSTPATQSAGKITVTPTKKPTATQSSTHP